MRFILSVLSKEFYGNNSKKCLFESIQRNVSNLFNLNKSILNNRISYRFQSSELNVSEDILSNSSHKLNCDIYILTKNGNLEITRGPFDRAHICQEYNLEPRDLQKIDTDIIINVPIIDVRQNRFICFSYRRLRNLVEYNRSIFFVPSSDKVLEEPIGIKDALHWEYVTQSYNRNVKYISKLYNERFINKKLNNINEIPFEFQITEINLETIAYRLKLKINQLLNEFKNIREGAYTRITPEKLRELALLKEKIDKYKRNVELAHQSIIDVLAQDEDMIGMYLTDKRQRDISDHVQIELLLEASAKQMAEVRRSISDLSDSVHTLENATGFMLDALRNELIGFEIQINIITMGFGIGAFITGLYGMNLLNNFEQNLYAFYIVTGTTFSFISGIIILGIIRLFRYRKIRLHRSNKN
ncbi:unnamed protein product [Rotaria sordida]|uniref:Magnesium transporter MRS2 homolog, mitochondrial n=1 Tax=Rotaria sordida TaxID=392033 RepID=A0A819SUX3_9BILA|nr:unnamed protein product [Rotaria sordida]CAF4056895.1 unnamed protein product [Rotaria sordida]